MIVRDEAAVIERCLASVRDHIDTWVICDTGSTDGTQDLVRTALSGIPGELHERPWVDFGHNRTELLRLARGKADFLLLLDADTQGNLTSSFLPSRDGHAGIEALFHPAADQDPHALVRRTRFSHIPRPSEAGPQRVARNG